MLALCYAPTIINCQYPSEIILQRLLRYYVIRDDIPIWCTTILNTSFRISSNSITIDKHWQIHKVTNHSKSILFLFARLTTINTFLLSKNLLSTLPETSIASRRQAKKTHESSLSRKLAEQTKPILFQSTKTYIYSLNNPPVLEANWCIKFYNGLLGKNWR